jgi:hypothetical protein
VKIDSLMWDLWDVIDELGYLEGLEKEFRRVSGHAGAIAFSAHPADFTGALPLEAAERNYRIVLLQDHPRFRIFCFAV